MSAGFSNYSWGDKRPYFSMAAYNKQKYGGRVQKVSVNAGFTCPNRDGKVAIGGCVYCNNKSFIPAYCVAEDDITSQINKGVDFLSKRYPRTKKFVAYFQSFSNTYASIDILRNVYGQALAHPAIEGLVISTRPDCINPEIAAYLKLLARQVIVQVELGIESTYDDTLDLINRGHNFQQTIDAFQMLEDCKIHLGGHLIFGLPGDTNEKIIAQVDKINQLPLNSIKFHQLQIIKNTHLAKMYLKNHTAIPLFNIEEYLRLVIRFVEMLKPTIAIERFISEAPPSIKIAPDWGHFRSDQFVNLVEKTFIHENSWQGKYYFYTN